MSTNTGDRIEEMRARIDRLQMKLGAAEHAHAEKYAKEDRAFAAVTQDYVNDLEEIARSLDETVTSVHGRERLVTRLAELERKVDETLKR